MNTRLVFLSAAIAIALTACQRSPSAADVEAERRRDEQIRQLDEKMARLQEQERQAAAEKLATAERRVAETEQEVSATEGERDRIEKERQALLRERDRLAEEKKTAQDRAANAERQAQETARRADEERAASTVGVFYTALDPHGDWIEAGNYGYVWQPTAASDPRWRPYTDGRWVFTDYGWFWKSNEPFGWAVYHYGRWTRLRGVGWVWVPGTEWGPAWVAWRRSDRFVGWAPLPPEAWSGSGFTAAVDSYYDIGPGSYTFVPVEEIGQPTYVGRVVEPERNVTIVNQSVNITNVTYKTVQKNTVIYNAGPDLADINTRGAQKVPQMKVERTTQFPSGIEGGRSEQKGETLVVAAPAITADKAPQKPVRVKQNLKAAASEHGWSEADKQGADQTRARLSREAQEAEAQQRQQGSKAVTKAAPAATPVPPPERPQSSSGVAQPATPANAQPGVIRRPDRPVAIPGASSETVPAVATPKPPEPAAEPGIPAKPTKDQPKPGRIRRVEQGNAIPPTSTPAAEKPVAPAPPLNRVPATGEPVAKPLEGENATPAGATPDRRPPKAQRSRPGPANLPGEPAAAPTSGEPARVEERATAAKKPANGAQKDKPGATPDAALR